MAAMGIRGGVPMHPGFDPTKAHSARVYDFYLGGKDHYAADRETGQKAMQSWRAVRTAVRENRAFLGRAVEYLVSEAGIRQFLDIGTGLPSANNVHEVAQAVAPESRIVYVDNDRCKPGCAHAITLPVKAYISLLSAVRTCVGQIEPPEIHPR
jgi:S-adenosyl methyltransferase